MKNTPRVMRLFLLMFVMAVFLLLSCDPDAYDGEIKDGNRDLIIDVENILFALPTETNSWEQGPGVTEIRFTIVLEGGSGDVEEILETADLDAGYNYTQLTIPVVGELKRVDANAYDGTTLLFSSTIEDKSSYDFFQGWEVFANVRKFKLGFHGYSEDWTAGYLVFNVAPRGGNNVAFNSDSGVTAPGEENTDWGGAALTSRQIAVEPILHENPTGLTFDIYTLVVDENLREKYKQGYLDPDAEYEYNPWEDVWTYDEVTGTGKLIAGTTYTLNKYNAGDPLNFIEPEGSGSGYDSFLIDLTGEAEDPVGKFLLIALVMQFDILSVPTAVDVIEIF